MEALILSCSTGGGHNAAAQAVADAIDRRGSHAILLDPYTLEGQNVADAVGSAYVNLVKSHPELFGLVYRIGKRYCQIQLRLPHKSPVYRAQKKAAACLKEYLEKACPDVIITTHVFCAEMLTMLADDGFRLPPIVYIATDYTCIPFTQEVKADYYVLGSEDIEKSFTDMGMDHDRLLPFGIPVKAEFDEQLSKEEACGRLNLDPELSWIVVAGGSMGFGLKDTLALLAPYVRDHGQYGLAVLTGSDEQERARLRAQYPDENIRFLGQVHDMPSLLQAGAAYISKPGGLSTTEACVANIPLILVDPIPGCETENAKFFMSHGMAMWAQDPKSELIPMLEDVLEHSEDMRLAQSDLQTGAADKIASFSEYLAGC